MSRPLLYICSGRALGAVPKQEHFKTTTRKIRKTKAGCDVDFSGHLQIGHKHNSFFIMWHEDAIALWHLYANSWPCMLFAMLDHWTHKIHLMTECPFIFTSVNAEKNYFLLPPPKTWHPMCGYVHGGHCLSIHIPENRNGEIPFVCMKLEMMQKSTRTPCFLFGFWRKQALLHLRASRAANPKITGEHLLSPRISKQGNTLWHAVCCDANNKCHTTKDLHKRIRRKLPITTCRTDNSLGCSTPTSNMTPRLFPIFCLHNRGNIRTRSHTKGVDAPWAQIWGMLQDTGGRVCPIHFRSS